MTHSAKLLLFVLVALATAGLAQDAAGPALAPVPTAVDKAKVALLVDYLAERIGADNWWKAVV